jgi:hypothetical protein
MSIRVNIANQVRQTNVVAWRPLLPLFEAVMNSFQAIKEAELPHGLEGQVIIEVIRQADLLSDDNPPISGFRITDNGIGLDDENWDSFNTAFSPHKLTRGGKGLGRFTWLKAFEHANIESTFKDEKGFQARSFRFDEDYDEDDRGLPKPSKQSGTGTVVELIDLKRNFVDQCPKTTDSFIQKLVEHFILVFIEPGCPRVTVIDLGQRYSLNEIFEKSYKSAASFHSFEIGSYRFSFHGFRLPSSQGNKHKLLYAADQRSVISEKLADYVPNLAARLVDQEGNQFFYVGIIQGKYLSEHVNNSRTSFDFGDPDDAELLELPLEGQSQLIPKNEIRDRALQSVQIDLREVIETLNAAKLETIRRYVHKDAPQYRILMRDAPNFIDKLTANPSRQEIETVLHRELFNRETELKKEGSRIIKEAGKITDYDQYHKKFEDFLDEYNELGVSALAQYVQHRRIILDFLERAINLPPDKKSFPLEKVVHHLVFPMQFTSEDIPSSEQNLWLVDERLTYHSFVSSDKKNKSLSVLDSDDNQRGDIVALDENGDFASDDSNDIFDEKIIFSDENRNGHPLNSIAVIEFKRPGKPQYKNGENPVLQATRVINAIRNGKYRHKGRKIPIASAEIPATIFVIADLTDKLREILIDFGATITPDNQGFYGYHPNHRVYYEVMDYTKMLADATKRNRIFFDKLNLVDNR